MYLLKTENLTKVFGTDVVVDGINIQVREGTIFGLIGPNGSGKSTTLKMLLGLLPPSSGNIFINNHSLKDDRRNYLKGSSAVLEAQGIYLDLPARKNLEIVCHIYGISLAEVDKTLDFVGLKEAGEKLPRHYSLGMKQRLALGCALISKPKLLFLDEPTNGLDPVAINELKSFIKALPVRGVTVLITSHSMADIDELCDDLAVLNKGQLLYQGNKDKFKRLFTRKLVIKVDDYTTAERLLSGSYDMERTGPDSEIVIAGIDHAAAAKINNSLCLNGVAVWHLAFTEPSLETVLIENLGHD